MNKDLCNLNFAQSVFLINRRDNTLSTMLVIFILYLVEYCSSNIFLEIMAMKS